MSYRKHLMTSDEPPSELYKATEVGTNLASLGTDCISREQAIDAVNCVTVMKGIRSGKSVTAEAVDCAKRIIADNIRQLPPIQPEIVRREECKYHHKRICPIERYFSLDGFCSRGDRGTT